jgi:hypothetical protein
MRVNLLHIWLMLVAACCVCTPTHGWESYELDLFDLVEEVNQNFYEFFEIQQVGSLLNFYFSAQNY